MTTRNSKPVTNDVLRKLLAEGNADLLRQHLLWRSQAATSFADLFVLSRIWKKAVAQGFEATSNAEKLRLAMIGACSLYPLHELVDHLLSVAGSPAELFIGEFDAYATEILNESSALYHFKPQVVLIVPTERRCKYLGHPADPREHFEREAVRIRSELLNLGQILHQRSGAEIVLCNFKLPVYFDPGPYRTRTLGSDWNFRKLVNLELGLNAPPYVHICDVEFLSSRRGGLASCDERAWHESKQPCAPDLMVDIAKEITHVIRALRIGPKKVLILDLDNTIWGGIVGDDGVEGIEIGGTSPRGEAFRAFQEYVLSLTQRGVLLAVCSKNDYDKAIEPFEKHPEMALRRDHFVSFKANWNPKPDNLRLIADELNLGLDSFVFLDDDPVEIDIVKEFTPEVSAILVGPDPSDYVKQLQDARLFEPLNITVEDFQRTQKYKQESFRKRDETSFTDLSSYLASLKMAVTISEFRSVDVPRIAQLINKSNQFNVATRRRAESEIARLINDQNCVSFSVRLSDRFGDYGLIGVVIGALDRSAPAPVFEIDTWLMSCRVLNRQVEEEMMNEIARLAEKHSCTQIRGVYIPTAKNQLVRNLYPRMGFQKLTETETHSQFSYELETFKPFPTRIEIVRRAYDPK
ncbi:MAG: HAD-IIIC family phosphatase [Pyrinomonadaceae bacterium]|nr:HAD-IIIC family phosphatase [Pyrinomonadaceae bacterium]